jgi:hypothetical protein
MGIKIKFASDASSAWKELKNLVWFLCTLLSFGFTAWMFIKEAISQDPITRSSVALMIYCGVSSAFGLMALSFVSLFRKFFEKLMDLNKAHLDITDELAHSFMDVTKGHLEITGQVAKQIDVLQSKPTNKRK